MPRTSARSGPAAIPEGSPAGPQPLSPPSILPGGFPGLESGDNPFATVPPDPQLAAGPNHLIEMINIVVAVYDKATGVEQDRFDLDNFFLSSPYPIFDPKVIYDSSSGRFFATAVSLCALEIPFCPAEEGRLHYAASTTDNPLDPWNLYLIQIPNDFPDYPGLGISDDKVTVSYNRFDIDAALGLPPPYSPGCDQGIGYCGVQTLVVEKAHMVSGVAAQFFGPHPNGVGGVGDLGHSTVRPAHSLTSTPTQYMASVSFATQLSPATQLHLWTITGTPALVNVNIADAAHPFFAGPSISPCLFTNPPGPACARQAGTQDLIHNGDNRILEAVWRSDGTNDRMWVSSATACTPAGDSTLRSCLKLFEVNTQTNSITQNITFGTRGAYYFYPAIRTDINGNLHVVFSRSSSSTFVSAGVVGRLSSDPSGSITGLCILKSGEVPYIQLPFESGGSGDTSPYRWGDYMGAAVDPVNQTIVWVVGQHANDDPFERWGTQIGRLQYPATGCPYGGDVDCDGDVDAVDALRILREVADLGNTLPLGCVFNGNVDCDSDTDAVDALRILRQVAGLGNTLPPGCKPISPP